MYEFGEPDGCPCEEFVSTCINGYYRIYNKKIHYGFFPLLSPNKIDRN